MTGLRSVVATLLAVVTRLDLWTTALRQLKVLARPGWWRRAPFLPVPDRDYLRFRMVTAYGGDGTGGLAAATPDDVIAYLEWCRTMRSL